MDKPSLLRTIHSSEGTSPQGPALRSSAPALEDRVPGITLSSSCETNSLQSPSTSQVRGRRSSTSTSQSVASSTASDRALLYPIKPNDVSSSSSRNVSPARLDPLRSSAPSSSVRSSPSPSRSPRKTAPAQALTPGRVFEDEQCFIIRDGWQAFVIGAPVINAKTNEEVFKLHPIKTFDAEVRNENKDSLLHISFRTPGFLSGLMSAKYRLLVGETGQEIAVVSESFTLSSKPKFSVDSTGAAIKMQGEFFEHEYTITMDGTVRSTHAPFVANILLQHCATVSRSACAFTESYQVKVAPRQDVWLVLGLTMVVDRVRAENHRSSATSLAVSL